jgi:hypothetical protein
MKIDKKNYVKMVAELRKIVNLFISPSVLAKTSVKNDEFEKKNIWPTS